jgi:hypothetical protein
VQRDDVQDADRCEHLDQDRFRTSLHSSQANLPVLANQRARYRLAESDVSDHVQSAAGATAFIHPKEDAFLFVQYDVLFEEIIGNL